MVDLLLEIISILNKQNFDVKVFIALASDLILETEQQPDIVYLCALTYPFIMNGEKPTNQRKVKWCTTCTNKQSIKSVYYVTYH